MDLIGIRGGGPTSAPPTYKELGIDKRLAHRWQVEASVPEGCRNVADVVGRGERANAHGTYANNGINIAG